MSFYPAPIGKRCPVLNCKWNNPIKTEQQYFDHLEKKHPNEFVVYAAEKIAAENAAAADNDDDDESQASDATMFDAEEAIKTLKEENKKISDQLNFIITTLAKFDMSNSQVGANAPFQTPVKSPFMSAIKSPFTNTASPLMDMPDVLIKAADAPKTGTVKLVAQGELKVSTNDVPVGKLILKDQTDYTVVYKDKKDKLCYYSPVKETGEMKKRMCTQHQTTSDRLFPLTEADLKDLGFTLKG